MISENYTKTAKAGYIAFSVMLCILGILLIAVPDFSVALATRICGGILTAFGVFRIIGYFSKDLYRLVFQYDLAFGILLITIGAVMLFRPSGLIHFVCAVIGVYILADGLMKIQISIDAKRFGLRSWICILLTAVLTCAVGLTMLFRPTESTRFLMILFGISLLAEGVLNMLTAVIAVKIRRKNIVEIKPSDYDYID
ncbi:MAG: DUF308 domain-containing protein [Ruminococcus flavefaciens]|nr:DUF308 domain-containing protein [Ruminococcus flavefaciens]MCM1230317.1 DUF308 domain-containing protein [Ruminococcus flavefaciens]